ncbi:hypothetical protein ACFQY7_06475 [Actinomadura luteofluorescens]|uniref:hypothetical protein n=1 Tax=Actinomadura luteofluorescens TaxID=46163 RepID=UPI003628F4A8
MVTRIETDYLVVGASATAMAFVDTLLTESDATVVMVDRYHQPGGHWTVAYPYVRLHQPSVMYGVNSRPLGNGAVDSAAGTPGCTSWPARARSAATTTRSCGRRSCRPAGCRTSPWPSTTAPAASTSRPPAMSTR